MRYSLLVVLIVLEAVAMMSFAAGAGVPDHINNASNTTGRAELTGLGDDISSNYYANASGDTERLIGHVLVEPLAYLSQDVAVWAFDQGYANRGWASPRWVQIITGPAIVMQFVALIGMSFLRVLK